MLVVHKPSATGGQLAVVVDSQSSIIDGTASGFSLAFITSESCHVHSRCCRSDSGRSAFDVSRHTHRDVHRSVSPPRDGLREASASI